MRHALSITLFLLLIAHHPIATADTISQSFELLPPPRITDPFVLDIPFRVNKVGMINVYVTFESSSSNKVKKLAALLMQDVRNKGKRAQANVKRNNTGHIQFAADSLNLKQTHKFFVRLANGFPQGNIKGRITIEYPGNQHMLPDLVITQARTDALCQVMYTVRNQGKGAADINLWKKGGHIDVAIERNNRFWGAVDLRVIDPAKRLVHPGGFAHYKTTLKAPMKGTENIALVIDRGNKLRESNEQNNRQNYAMKCATPDLIVSQLYLDEQCRVVAEIKNQGNANLLPTAYQNNGPSVFIKRNGSGWGGQALANIDPQRELMRPGGSVIYKSNLKVTEQPVKIQVLVDNENRIKESNEKNNFRNAELKCGDNTGAPAKLKPIKPIRLKSH